MIPLSMRKEMIDRDEGAMSVCNQCELLGLARSTLYYTPSKASDKDLKMMEELGRLVPGGSHAGNSENDQGAQKERV